jgi:hypothetical protein
MSFGVSVASYFTLVIKGEHRSPELSGGERRHSTSDARKHLSQDAIQPLARMTLLDLALLTKGNFAKY